MRRQGPGQYTNRREIKCLENKDGLSAGVISFTGRAILSCFSSAGVKVKQNFRELSSGLVSKE